MKNINLKTFNKNMEGYIRHEYPVDGKSHPFDVNCQLQHFLYANGFTYLMTIDKTKQISEIKKVIPKSYMPFSICERYIMINNGSTVWKNQNVNNVEECYKILAFQKEEIEPNNFSHEINNTRNLKNDIDVILEKSKKNARNIYMVVKII
mgnify:FL=1